MKTSTGRERAWEILAQTWADTSYDEIEKAAFAKGLAETGLSRRELNRIAYWEVCGAFATFSTTVFATAGMALPDYCFPKDVARESVTDWISRPLVFSLINPLWLLGYLLSLYLMRATMGSVLSAATRNT